MRYRICRTPLPQLSSLRPPSRLRVHTLVLVSLAWPAITPSRPAPTANVTSDANTLHRKRRRPFAMASTLPVSWLDQGAVEKSGRRLFHIQHLARGAWPTHHLHFVVHIPACHLTLRAHRAGSPCRDASLLLAHLPVACLRRTFVRPLGSSVAWQSSAQPGLFPSPRLQPLSITVCFLSTPPYFPAALPDLGRCRVLHNQSMMT